MKCIFFMVLYTSITNAIFAQGLDKNGQIISSQPDYVNRNGAIGITGVDRNGQLQVTANSVGQSYQGGIIAYILQPGDSGYVIGQVHGLIVAPTDQGQAVWWGCQGTAISGADGTAIGTGNQNTIDILAGCATAGIAARLCKGVTINGYNDWYLPSKSEIYKVYLNKDAIGGLTPWAYWTSSESSSSRAWIMWFDDGNPGDDYAKGSGPTMINVRAMRSF